MVDFLGIGAQKAGTTWLFHQLARHPQIAFPAGKELHFWDNDDPRPADAWCRVLEPAARRCPDGRPVRSGEITPAYAILPRETIEAIRRCCPDLRLFISLRNPLERAWSAAVMVARRTGRPEGKRTDEWFLEQFRTPESLARGDYAACLDRWWSVFPPERLLVLFHDDIRRTPAAVLGRLACHLEVDEADFARIPAAALAEVVVPALGSHKAGNDRPVGPIRASLLPALRELYTPLVGRVAALVGRDLDSWLEPPSGDGGGGEMRRSVNAAATPDAIAVLARPDAAR